MALSDEQKRMRADGYGASEVATVVRRGHARLIELFERKVDPRRYDVDDDAGLAAELGTLEEEPVAKVYARRTGTWLATVASLRHPTKPLAIATPDRARFVSEHAWRMAHAKASAGLSTELPLTLEAVQEADRLVEVKTHAGRFRRDYGPEGTGRVPAPEAIQVTWQMGVTGLKVADIPVLFRGDWGVKLEVFTVGFNEELFDWLYESVERFHVDHVLARKPPEPDGSEEYSEAMERLHAVVRKAHLTATPDDEELILRYAKFAEVEKRAGKYKELTAQALMQRIGESGGLVSGDLGKLSWISVRETSQVDWKRAANEALQLAGLCLNAFDHLAEVGEQISPENRARLAERLKAILPESTKTRNGYRYLKLFPKGNAQLELMRLNVALDALGEGET